MPTANAVSTEAVLRALRSRGALSRSALVAATGLSRPTVAAVVSRLTADGVVDESSGAPSGRGRPSRSVRLSPRRAAAVGLEIGRGHVAVALGDAAGDIVANAERAVDPHADVAGRTRRALALLATTARRGGIDLAPVRRAAVGTPGPRFGAAGVPGRWAGQQDDPVRRQVAELVGSRLGVPVDVGNNTRFTALAVARSYGPDVDLVFLRVDEGVGGGVVHDGEVTGGAHGAAGEMGHVTVDPFGARCSCGGRGCLELLAGLPAVLRAARARDLDDLRARSEQKRVRDAVERAAVATGTVLAGVVAVADPGVLVLGGSVATLPGFVPEVERIVRSAAPEWALTGLRIDVAPTDHLQGAAGAAQAAAAALDTVAAQRKQA